MLALMNLETRRLFVMLPLVAVMLAFGLGPVILFAGGQGTVGVAFIAMTAIALVTRIFPFDAAGSRANTLAGTLPVTRHQVIAARYAMALLVAVAAGLLVPVALSGATAAERAGAGALLAAMPLLHLIVIGPLSSRGGLGPVAPAFAQMLPLAIVFVVAGFVMMLPDDPKRAVLVLVLRAPALSAGIAVTVILALLVVSYVLSTRWFESRDL